MISNCVTILLAWLSLFRPSMRFLISPSGLRIAFTERQHEISLLWTSPYPLWQTSVLVRQLECAGDSEVTEWKKVHPSEKWNRIHASGQWEMVATVILREIGPECIYEYSVGAGVIWTPVRKLKVWTPYYEEPSEIDLNHVAKLIVIGDLGVGSSGDRTRIALQRQLAHNQSDAILHLGDIAYDLDVLCPSLSRAYFQAMEPLTSVTPYMVLPGNHEEMDNFTQYKANFHMPVTIENQGTSYFYSFNLGRAHFVALSGEHLYNSEGWERQKHISWLKRDLQMANIHRDRTPWVVVMAHRPLYCNTNYRPDAHSQFNQDCTIRASLLRSLIENLLVEEKVDLFLEAHIHNYQRLGPILRNETRAGAQDAPHYVKNAGAPVYILEGAAGNEEGQDWLSPTSQLWTVVQRREIGFGVLSVVNSSHLYWEHRDSDTGAVEDWLWLERPV